MSHTTVEAGFGSCAVVIMAQSQVASSHLGTLVTAMVTKRHECRTKDFRPHTASQDSLASASFFLLFHNHNLNV